MPIIRKPYNSLLFGSNSADRLSLLSNAGQNFAFNHTTHQPSSVRILSPSMPVKQGELRPACTMAGSHTPMSIICPQVALCFMIGIQTLADTPPPTPLRNSVGSSMFSLLSKVIFRIFDGYISAIVFTGKVTIM